jgi:hypothetical protein
VRRHRLHLVAADDLRTLPGHAEHQRLAWAVDVCIEQAHLRAKAMQRKRKVHGRGGFADTAFA